MAIQSFASPAVARFFLDGRLEKRVGWASQARVAARKLDMVDYAERLADLALKGDRAGFHSIRINDRWRVVFRWTDRGPAEINILDYH